MAEKPKPIVRDFIVALVLPAVVGKAMILYFGGNYTSNPGEGWGYALSLAIVFTVFMVIRFLWRYRNYKD